MPSLDRSLDNFSFQGEGRRRSSDDRLMNLTHIPDNSLLTHGARNLNPSIWYLNQKDIEEMALLCKVNWEYFPVFSRVSGIY